MLNLIYTELLKLKRTKILWVLLMAIILLTLLNFTFQYNSYIKFEEFVEWESCIAFIAYLINITFAVPFIAMITGFVFSCEYRENTINTLFSYPISRIELVISKLTTIYIIIVVTFILFFVSSIIVGLILPHEVFTKEIFINYLKTYLLMSIMHFALVPTAAFMASFSKNIIAPITLGLAAVFITLFATTDVKYVNTFPWSAPVIATPTKYIGWTQELSFTTGIISISLTFIISIAALLIYIKKADIHCGS